MTLLQLIPSAPLQRPEAAPLVSVVIPCYNSARYLAETIESVLAQTYPRIEIIVVDDGSTDSTAEIAGSYPVQYFFQKNCGISAARNSGVLDSQGKYIQFLDHDDRLLPDALALGVKLLEAHPQCSMAVGEHRYVQADGTVIGSSQKNQPGRDHYQELLEHNFVETPCSVLHRRSALDAAGLFAENVQGAEDYELYLRTARQMPVITHGEPVADYRLHDANISANAERMFLVTLRVLQMEAPHVKSNRLHARSHRRGIRFAQRQFGRRLTREMAGNRLRSADNDRKLAVLREQYRPGWVVVMLSRMLPASLVNRLIEARVHPNEFARSARAVENLSPS